MTEDERVAATRASLKRLVQDDPANLPRLRALRWALCLVRYCLRLVGL